MKAFISLLLLISVVVSGITSYLSIVFSIYALSMRQNRRQAIAK